MSDLKPKTIPQDPKRVNVNDSAELEYWSAKYGITPNLLKIAVRKAGAMAGDVERELKHQADRELAAAQKQS